MYYFCFGFHIEVKKMQRLSASSLACQQQTRLETQSSQDFRQALDMRNRCVKQQLNALQPSGVCTKAVMSPALALTQPSSLLTAVEAAESKHLL